MPSDKIHLRLDANNFTDNWFYSTRLKIWTSRPSRRMLIGCKCSRHSSRIIRILTGTMYSSSYKNGWMSAIRLEMKLNAFLINSLARYSELITIPLISQEDYSDSLTYTWALSQTYSTIQRAIPFIRGVVSCLMNTWATSCKCADLLFKTLWKLRISQDVGRTVLRKLLKYLKNLVREFWANEKN